MVPEGSTGLDNSYVLDLINLCLNGRVLEDGTLLDPNGKEWGKSVLKEKNLKKFIKGQPPRKRKRKDDWAWEDE